MTVDLTEFLDNPEPRCPVALALDVSKSMAGAAIDELNAGLAAFRRTVAEDAVAALRIEVAAITFGRAISVPQGFVTADRFDPPLLTAGGKTPLGGALEVALDLIDRRRQAYRRHGVPYYRPWLFLISDGAPTDGERWQVMAERIAAAEAERRLRFYAVGVEGADFRLLGKLATPARPPIRLQRLDFRPLFEWLSMSVRCVSTRVVGGDDDELELPALPEPVAPAEQG
jgi:uncharacterized protein YegL